MWKLITTDGDDFANHSDGLCLDPSIMMTAATVSVVTPIRPSRKSYEWKSIPENGFKSM